MSEDSQKANLLQCNETHHEERWKTRPNNSSKKFKRKNKKSQRKTKRSRNDFPRSKTHKKDSAEMKPTSKRSATKPSKTSSQPKERPSLSNSRKRKKPVALRWSSTPLRTSSPISLENSLTSSKRTLQSSPKLRRPPSPAHKVTRAPSSSKFEIRQIRYLRRSPARSRQELFLLTSRLSETMSS